MNIKNLNNRISNLTELEHALATEYLDGDFLVELTTVIEYKDVWMRLDLELQLMTCDKVITYDNLKLKSCTPSVLYKHPSNNYEAAFKEYLDGLLNNWNTEGVLWYHAFDMHDIELFDYNLDSIDEFSIDTTIERVYMYDNNKYNLLYE